MSVGADVITVHKGQDVTLSFGPLSPLEDITGWTISFYLRGSSALALATISHTNNGGAAGTFDIVLADTHTENLRLGTYLYDVWRIDDGSEKVLARGEFRLLGVARIVET